MQKKFLEIRTEMCQIKGQLISERNFGVFKSSSKKESNFGRISALTSKMGQIKKISMFIIIIMLIRGTMNKVPLSF